MPLITYYSIIGYYELTLISSVILLQMRGLIMLLKTTIIKSLITVILIAKRVMTVMIMIKMWVIIDISIRCSLC